MRGTLSERGGKERRGGDKEREGGDVLPSALGCFLVALKYEETIDAASSIRALLSGCFMIQIFLSLSL